MKKEINRTLGNSLRCILPSFWWKRLLGMIVDKIDSAEDAAVSAMNVAMLAGVEASNKQDELVSGSNIKTINGMSILGSGNIVVDTDTDKVEKYKTKEELDAVGSTDGGEIAAVVDAVLVEKSFTECYQPTSAEISTSKYNTKFTKVDGLALNPDFNPNLISSNYGSLIVVLYSDGKSKGYHKGYPSHLEIECDYNRRIICWEYDGTSGSGHSLYDSSGFYASAIDRVNNILREGNFRFSYFEVTYKKNADDTGYTYYYSYNDNFPADATAMIDNVVKMLFAETQNADIYVRSSEWVRLLKEGDVTGGAGAIIDSELSTSSKNAVQNKVITAALNSKVDKVNGKQLSTEDFTSALKTKLEGLSNYDDTSIQNAVNSLTTQIARKQDIISDLATIRSGASKGATAIQSVKTINGQSIVGSGNIVINPDTSNLVTKDEFEDLTNEILDNEKATAEAFVYLDEEQKKIAANQESFAEEYVKKESVESSINQLTTSIEQIISDNEEVTATALTDLNGRLVEIFDMMENDYVQKKTFNSTVETLSDTVNLKADNAEMLDALTTLNNHVNSLYTLVDDRVTKGTLAETIEELNNIISTNEEVVAFALNDINEKSNLLEQDIVAIESNNNKLFLAINELNERIVALETIINS